MTEVSTDTQSKKLPFNLTQNEFVIREFPRSKLPYLLITTITAISAGFFFLSYIDMVTGGNGWIRRTTGISVETAKEVSPILAVLSFTMLLSGAIAAYIYSANRMFLTNEHIVRIKQDGLVATDKKVISHLNIEDIKARQNFIGSIFGYGLLVMSTEGQNATYEINFIKQPFEQVTMATDVRDEYQQSVVDSGGRAIPLAEKR
ncbi:MAG: PH domain-containing protein [Candidatus Nomurabacteria bacterium]|nr:MAG: PH domain-containing protein [Candidatus Nomurabacteria bacterium]HRV76132.1 PH domain-containing protein [Candidatus Saccharimonadales bacterium]